VEVRYAYVATHHRLAGLDMRLLFRFGVALLSGFVASLAMPPREAPWPLLMIGIACIYSCATGLRPRASWLIGLAGAIGYFGPLLRWMDVVGSDAWLLVVALCSFWWCLAFGWLPSMQKFRFPGLAFATVWTAFELLRDLYPWGGFGWAQFGVIAPLTPFEGLAPNLGQIPITWLAMAVSCTAVDAAKAPHLVRTPSMGLAVLSLLAVAYVPLDGTLVRDESATKKFVVVQGGVDHYGLGTFGDVRSVLKHHIDATRAATQQVNDADLVIWPENAADVNPMADVVSAEMLNSLIGEIEPPILLGAVVAQPDDTLHNISLLWSRAGYSEKYVKRKIVPFGEFLPFREFVTSWTDRAALMPRDFSPGTTHGSLDLGNFHLGILICFEVADSGLALTDDDNASAWVIHTNNATYQFRGQSEQQLLAARMRAAETSRPVLVSSTSGISAIIDSRGQIDSSISQSEVGAISARLGTVTGQTFAMISYPFWKYGFLVMAIALIVLTKLRSRSASKVHQA